MARDRDREAKLECLTGKGRANGVEGLRLLGHMPGNRGTGRFACRRNPQLNMGFHPINSAPSRGRGKVQEPLLDTSADNRLSRREILGVQEFRRCESSILQIAIKQEIWKLAHFSSVGGTLADWRKVTPYRGGWLRFGVFFARGTR